jgi:cellulose synthase/poly-beta-1,6-N-acetylglucosamine synthase-like glycosyltransferase
MSAVAATLALAALALVLWSYLFYPAVLARLARGAPDPARSPRPDVSVEVLVSAADEEWAIGARVLDLLAQSPELRVAVGCDGCRDATAARARETGNGRLRVLEFPSRRGKASVLNDLVESSRAQVLVFTDANTRFEPRAVENLLRPFSDPRVGAVCGRLLFDPGRGGAAEPETAFWDRETRWKELEGRLGVCLGANGAIYAARRELVRPLPPDCAMDDFLIPARIAGGGWRVVFAADAVAREESPPDVRAEMARRFRIGVGAGRVLREELWLLRARRHPLLSLVFFSRKLARWLAPLAALGAALAALGDGRMRPFALAALALVLTLAATTVARPRLRGVAGRLYYFVVINLAVATGIIAGLAGYRRPVWARAAR